MLVDVVWVLPFYQYTWDWNGVGLYDRSDRSKTTQNRPTGLCGLGLFQVLDSLCTPPLYENPTVFCGVKGHLRSRKVKIWNLCVRGSLIREVCAKKGAVCTVTRPVGFRDAWVFVQEISRQWQAGLEITMGLWHIRAKNCSNCTRKGQSGVYQMSVSHDSLIRQNNCCTKFS